MCIGTKTKAELTFRIIFLRLRLVVVERSGDHSSWMGKKETKITKWERKTRSAEYSQWSSRSQWEAAGVRIGSVKDLPRNMLIGQSQREPTQINLAVTSDYKHRHSPPASHARLAEVFSFSPNYCPFQPVHIQLSKTIQPGSRINS